MLFTPDIKQDIIPKLPNVTTAKPVGKNNITNPISNADTRNNIADSITKSFIFLFSITATLVPNIANIGRNEYSIL